MEDDEAAELLRSERARVQQLEKAHSGLRCLYLPDGDQGMSMVAE